MVNISVKHKLSIVLSTIALLCVLLVPVTVSAQNPSAPASGTTTANPQNGVRCGANIDLSNTTCANTNTGSTQLNTLIKNIINIFSAVVGAVSVIMIIIGGFRYITSGGDSNNVGAAKNTILYAIVGLVLVAVAQIIVQFILERTT